MVLAISIHSGGVRSVTGFARRSLLYNASGESIVEWRHVIRSDDGIHRAVSGRYHCDAGCLARPALTCADAVRRGAARLRRDLSAPCDRYLEAVVLRPA